MRASTGGMSIFDSVCSIFWAAGPEVSRGRMPDKPVLFSAGDEEACDGCDGRGAEVGGCIANWWAVVGSGALLIASAPCPRLGAVTETGDCCWSGVAGVMFT